MQQSHGLFATAKLLVTSLLYDYLLTSDPENLLSNAHSHGE